MRPESALFIILIVLFYSFVGDDTNHVTTAAKPTGVQDTVKKPTVFVEEHAIDTMIILTIKDTAASEADISTVIGAGYSEIYTYITRVGLQPGRPMAFYYTFKPPYIMNIAVEINKIPAQLTGRIRLNKIPARNAVIAHYKGPYEKIDIAYTAIFDWLKEHGKRPWALPFEVYLNEPAAVKDPFEL